MLLTQNQPQRLRECRQLSRNRMGTQSATENLSVVYIGANIWERICTCRQRIPERQAFDRLAAEWDMDINN
jgi:hypothetical protein